MTKKLITLLIACVMTISVLSACSGTVTSSETKKGDYELFYTSMNEAYLKFLNEFNKEKYEIIDISHSNTYWYVTYKIKE